MDIFLFSGLSREPEKSFMSICKPTFRMILLDKSVEYYCL